MTRLAVGISTCPNDTFTFHALLEGLVDSHGIEFDFRLLDIEELNGALSSGELDVAKISASAAIEHAADWTVLPVGWAVGFGVGPVVLRRPGELPERPRVLAPGARTTASLLWRVLHPEGPVPEEVLFSTIVPALERGEADLGVCIHEGRFTYREHGLELAEDLGNTFEQRTGSPLPLGGLAGRRAVPTEKLRAVARAVRGSLDWAHTHREATLPTLRRHAQEHSDEVLWAHVDLYVSRFTADLGAEGEAALGSLEALARGVDRIPPRESRLTVLRTSSGDE